MNLPPAFATQQNWLREYGKYVTIADVVASRKTSEPLNIVVARRVSQSQPSLASQNSERENATEIKTEENLLKNEGWKTFWLICALIAFILTFIFAFLWLNFYNRAQQVPTLYQITGQQLGVPYQRTSNDWNNTIIYTLQNITIPGQSITATFVGSQSYPTMAAAAASAAMLPSLVGMTVGLFLNSSATLIYQPNQNVFSLLQVPASPPSSELSPAEQRRRVQYAVFAATFWFFSLLFFVIYFTL